jgi:hypothetical protein
MYSLQNFFGLQDPHTDLLGIHQQSAMNIIPGVNLAYSIILALEADTYVLVFDSNDSSKPPTKVDIKKGQMFIFAGDVIHGGMDSQQHDNMRAHVILKTREFSAGGNEQGWMKRIHPNLWVYKVGCNHTDYDADVL